MIEIFIPTAAVTSNFTEICILILSFHPNHHIQCRCKVVNTLSYSGGLGFEFRSFDQLFFRTLSVIFFLSPLNYALKYIVTIFMSFPIPRSKVSLIRHCYLCNYKCRLINQDGVALSV
jgi:hypothetical protein